MPYRRYRGRIETHADADKKDAEQHIAERAYARFHLVPEFGFTQHHSGEEGTERQGQSKAAGGPCGQQCDQQHGQRKHFRRPALRNQVEQRAQQPAPGKEHQRKRKHRFYERPPQRARERSGADRNAQYRDDHQEGHGGYVLKDRHGESETAVVTVLLTLLGQLAADDGRG